MLLESPDFLGLLMQHLSPHTHTFTRLAGPSQGKT